jgi:hypothetical protein
MTWDRVKGRLKIAWPAVGLLVGLSAGACFLYLHAWETAGFALVSGAYALLLMSFTIKSYLNLKAVERCDELTTDEEVASLYDEQDENNSNEPYYASSVVKGTTQQASLRDRHHSRRGHLVAERPESWTWWTYRWACFVAAAAGASVGTSGIIAYALLAQGNHESLSPTSHWLTIGTPRPSLHRLSLTCLVMPPLRAERGHWTATCNLLVRYTYLTAPSTACLVTLVCRSVGLHGAQVGVRPLPRSTRRSSSSTQRTPVPPPRRSVRSCGP